MRNLEGDVERLTHLLTVVVNQLSSPKSTEATISTSVTLTCDSEIELVIAEEVKSKIESLEIK